MAMHSWLANPRETRQVLDRYGLATKHRLGQNFLVNDAVIGKILDLAHPDDHDVIMEIGPGIGTLTVGMLPHAGAVVAIEADRSLAPVLAETCAQDSERFALVLGDALKVSPETLVDAVRSLDIAGLDPHPTALVANLPYQVAATVVLQTFEQQPSVGRAVVMVQAEVADRMAATPGTKAYGGYTAKLALHARATGRFEVGPGNFLPPPHVNSAVIRLERCALSDPDSGMDLTNEQIAWCCEVIDAAFAQRRKTIRNSMSARGIDREQLDRSFEETGIDPAVRAEKLAPADFVRLAASLGWR